MKSRHVYRCDNLARLAVASSMALMGACDAPHAPSNRPSNPPHEPAPTTASIAPSPAAAPAHTSDPGDVIGAGSPYRIRYDQLGYLPLESNDRFAVVVATSASPATTGPHYRIEDAATRATLKEGTAGPRVLDVTSRAGTKLSGDRIDLGTLGVGRYTIVLDDGTRTAPFRVGKDAYEAILPLVGRFLAEQRCGPTTKAVSLHDACHLFDNVAHAHAGDGIAVNDGTPPPYAGKSIDAEGGWHDAGDYIKFVGTTAFVLATELMALRDHQAALGEAGDALALELRWGLDWLLKMVGGPEPYHQVGGEGDHDAGWRLPEGDTQDPIKTYDQRPVFRMAKGRGRNLLGRSAAAFVFGAQVYGARDPAYAQTLQKAAVAAYSAAKARSGIQNPDPPEFYNERSGDDDLTLAAAALARLTGKSNYATDAHAFGMRLSRTAAGIGWDSSDALALLEAARAFPVESRERAELTARLAALAAPIAATAKTPIGPGAAFGYALPHVGNGSIAESLGAAATCMAARKLTGAPGCDIVAARQLHWMLGENPFGVSYLVGAGSKWPQNMHHSFGIAAHVVIPGAMPGGPTALRELVESELPPPPATDPYAAYSTDDLLYEDRVDNYICNEPAIDFAAALVFVLGELSEAT